MRATGFTKEAEFVRLIRCWFEAEDDPGISTQERCQRRLELKRYLLSDVNFGKFPPTTRYIQGIPIVTYEELLAHIVRKMQIYSFLPTRSYNVRSLGTQEVEQFFSTFRDLATATMLDNIRINPERSFYMKTSRASGYPDTIFHRHNYESLPIIPAESTTGFEIHTRDHFFNNRERRRTKAKRKSGLVAEPNCPSKGEIGVRQYHRCDESKVLAHHCKGLEII